MTRALERAPGGRGSLVAEALTDAPTSRPRLRTLGMLVSAAGILGIAGAGIGSSLALFTGTTGTTQTLGTQAIFPGRRVTPAFVVGDASGGGAPVDRSSPFLAAADGRTFTTGPWPSTSASDRYLDLDLHAPLAGGLSASGATFELRFASAAGGTACYHFEVRRRSTGALLGTYGSGASPRACVTGATLVTSTTSIAASASTTDLLDDLRIRILASDTGAGSLTIDRAVVTGNAAGTAFRLVPVRTTDAADGTPASHPWQLAGP